jgi:ADP-dependent NAD(P)H-hydrate dehydratase / NAD(P)H-hydrate epimerase
VLPVLSAAEMREVDGRAIRQLGSPGRRLMEAAGTGAAALVAGRFGPIRGRRVVIVCGKGNNGGDGFVVARRLAARGARVRVYLAGRRQEVKGDAAQAVGRWRGPVTELRDGANLDRLARDLGDCHVIVDALLGTGLAGPARGLTAELIQAINRAGQPVVALDLPSGLDADRGELIGPTVKAEVTATFAGYKRALLLHPACDMAGEVSVIPIGIPADGVGTGITTWLLEGADVRALLPARRADSHKGTFGHLLVVAGSLGKTGAAALTGRAALRTGVGLVTVATAASQQPVVAVLSPEAMTEALPETSGRSIALGAKVRLLELGRGLEAVALGPGLSLDEETQALVRTLVVEVERPMVVDADGLNALAGHVDLLPGAAAPRILTPHPGEMSRLIGASIAEVQADRLGTVREFCRQYGTWLVLKGARSVLGAPDGSVYINPTGNPGMATGGAGDALTGMIGAFLARGLSPLAALQAGVYLHGRAGDLAAAAIGPEGLIASDIVEHIPAALREPA